MGCVGSTMTLALHGGILAGSGWQWCQCLRSAPMAGMMCNGSLGFCRSALSLAILDRMVHVVPDAFRGRSGFPCAPTWSARGGGTASSWCAAPCSLWHNAWLPSYSGGVPFVALIRHFHPSVDCLLVGLLAVICGVFLFCGCSQRLLPVSVGGFLFVLYGQALVSSGGRSTPLLIITPWIL